MEHLMGIKELYDVNIRLNESIDIGKRHYDINETILSFEKAEFAQIKENKNYHQATGGYNDKMLMEWELDKSASFSLTHGVLSPYTWAALSNSQLKSKCHKSVPYKEEVQIYEEEDKWIGRLKYIPNHIDKSLGLQHNPDNEALPMGRKDWIPLKPLQPSKTHYIFCYDADTGQRIMNFEVYGNLVIFRKEHNNVMVDYTFDYDDSIIELEVGNRLINGFLNLTAKVTTKDYFDGEPKTAILEIPRIKINSSLFMSFSEGEEKPIVSEFYFTGYPEENKYLDEVFKLTFLNHELEGEYL